MSLALLGSMPSRFFRRSGLVALTSVAISLSGLNQADASGALLSSGVATPVEERIAVAVGPTRTTVWTSLRVDADAGAFALVVPVPPGATLDHSSDAWLEALDAATAPRVFPPIGASAYCPGVDPPNGAPDPFHVTTDLGKTSSLKPSTSILLADAPAVAAWAGQQGLALAPEMLAALEAMPATRFWVELFDAPNATITTSTLRIVLPSQTPVVPLALTRAGFADLLVTSWSIGEGRATLEGSTPLLLTPSSLHWRATDQTSNYVQTRHDQLVSKGPSALLIESASHDALVKNLAIANGTGSITGVVRGFFERASTYGDGNQSPAPCITAAGVALGSVYPLATSCPRAELGVVDGSPTCVEAPMGAEVNPSLLRCGGITDDLAVALSGLVPSTTWLTRGSMIVSQKGAGKAWTLSFGGASTEAPPITAGSIDLAGCAGGGAGGAPGSSGASGATGPATGGQGAFGGGAVVTGVGAGNSYNPTVDPDVGCACAGTADPVVVDDGSGGDYPVEDTSSGDCSGDTTDTTTDTTSDTSSGDCSGDTTDTTTDTTSDTSSGDCSGDTTTDTTTDTTSDTSSGDCSGDTTTDTSASSSSTDCSSDTSDTSSDDCSGDTTTDTYSAEARSTRAHPSASPKHARLDAPKPRKRGPKVSLVAFGVFALLAPLRRLGRPQRRRSSQAKRSS